MFAGVAHLAPEVDAVGGEEQQAEARLEGEGDEAESDLEDEDGEEPALVAG